MTDDAPRRVLVTGSAGFIGFHTVRRLLAAGARVLGVDNFSAYYDAALIRLVGALMLEQTDEWAVGRRYLSLESLAKLGDTEPRQLAAVAA